MNELSYVAAGLWNKGRKAGARAVRTTMSAIAVVFMCYFDSGKRHYCLSQKHQCNRLKFAHAIYFSANPPAVGTTFCWRDRRTKYHCCQTATVAHTNATLA